MTISSSVRKAGPYTGDGSTSLFPFAFAVFDTTNIQVTIADSAGVETILAQGTDYSVALNSDQNTNPGGSVTYLLAQDHSLVVLGNISYDQTTELTNNGGFYPKVIEKAMDRLAVQIQQLAESNTRAVKVGATSDTSPDKLIAELQENTSLAVSSAAAAKQSETNAKANVDAAVADAQSKANAAAESASVSATSAAASAARINLPPLSGSDAGKLLQVKEDGSGYQNTDEYAKSSDVYTKSQSDGRYLKKIGETYIQFPDTLPPASLFGGTWEAVLNTEGVFWRSEGGNALAFDGGVQADAIRNIRGWFDIVNTTLTDNTLFQKLSNGSNSGSSGGGTSRTFFDASKVVPTAAENRPVNRTWRIWIKRAD